MVGWLDVRGPGMVVLGEGVIIDRTVTAWTYTRDAVIQIGSGSYVNGTRFGCRLRIEVGPRSILGESHIFDSDFHSTQANRWDASAPIRTKPVVLEENVWVGAEAGILPGTHIGANSVVGFGAVCSGAFAANSIIAGNPARVVRQIPETQV
jgi:acetyltransferase-like isoleucine patch superfamily enzyme